MRPGHRRNLCLVTLALLLVLSAPVAFAQDSATVFVYHRFGDQRYPSTNISLDDFRAHLSILKAEQFTVLPLGEIVDRLRNGEPLPLRCAAITVDDAYRTFLTGAVPLLDQFDYPATLFVSTGSVGGKDYLTWAELKNLSAAGIELGNHSDGHDYLVNRRQGEGDAAWARRVMDDLRTSQQQFKTQLGTAPELFAYPYGEYDPALVRLVQELGFKGAVAQQSGVMSRAADLYTLPRFPMAEAYRKDFRSKLLMSPLPVDIISPMDPVITRHNNPPELRVRIDMSMVDPASLRCFVSGQEDGLIRVDGDEPDLLKVVAQEPLRGRRSKYTLTARGRDGRWYWFSQLWIRPDR